MIKITSPTYSIVPHGSKFRLVRVIGEYSNKREADDDVFDILSKKKTEDEIEKKKGVRY